MEIKSYKPQNPILRDCIECFYTLTRTPADESCTYLTFPSVFSMVCLNANARVKLKKNGLSIVYSPDNTLESSLVCDFDNAAWVQYEGAADEIVIYFKPLGLNAFLEKDLRHYSRHHFTEFNPFADFKNRMTEIFSLDNNEDRIRALEAYWLSKLKGFNHPFLYEVIGEMTGEDGLSSVSEIARKYDISRTTINKHFDLHLCTTPSQFKKVLRFRNAMRRHRLKISEESLADISCGADYFDQSHMIKDFKSLTNYAPKTFFSKISALEDGQINWLFL